jgi:hypothetical protein
MQNYKITITNVADHGQRFPRIGMSTVEYMEALGTDQVEQRVIEELTACALDLSLYSWTITPVE